MKRSSKTLSALRATVHGAVYYWLFCFGYSSIDSFLNLYYARLGFSGSQIGLLAAQVSLMTILIAPLITRFADRHQARRETLAATLILMGTAVVLLSLPRTFLPIFILYSFMAAFRSPSMPLADTLATRLEKKTGGAYGTMRAAGSLGGAMASIGLGFVWERVGFHWMFLTAAVILALAGFSAFLFRDDRSLVGLPARQNIRLKTMLQNRNLRYLWGACFLIWSALIMSWAFEGVYADRLGAAESLVGMIRGVGIAVEVPMIYLSTRLLKKHSPVRIIYLAGFLLALSHLIYSLVPDPRLLLLVSLVKGGGVGLLIPSVVRAVSNEAPEEAAASYQGFSSAILWGAAPLVGSLFGGVLFDLLGARSYYAIAAIVSAVGVLILFNFLLRSPEPEDPASPPETVEARFEAMGPTREADWPGDDEDDNGIQIQVMRRVNPS